MRRSNGSTTVPKFNCPAYSLRKPNPVFCERYRQETRGLGPGSVMTCWKMMAG